MAENCIEMGCPREISANVVPLAGLIVTAPADAEKASDNNSNKTPEISCIESQSLDSIFCDNLSMMFLAN